MLLHQHVESYRKQYQQEIHFGLNLIASLHVWMYIIILILSMECIKLSNVCQLLCFFYSGVLSYSIGKYL